MGKAQQVEIEQRSIEGMYVHLEGEQDRLLAARDATMASSVDGIEAIAALGHPLDRETVRRLEQALRSST